MTTSTLIERITRSLAYMLRHKPEEFDLELDRFGSADVNEVVQALNERLGGDVELEDLEDAIEAGDRVRYRIEKGRIRALYGHSIEVDPGEPSRPPELLYIGVGSRDADRAERFGLKGGRRSFLHLARTTEEAMETGRRTARDYVVVTVHALDAWEQGVNFYDREALVLAESIPTEFLSLGDVHTDGRPPERGRRDARGRGGRGRDDDRRGRRRRDEEDEDERPRRDDDRGGRRRDEDRGERRRDEDRGERRSRDRDRDRDRDDRRPRGRREERDDDRPRRDRDRGERGDRRRDEREPKRERTERPRQTETRRDPAPQPAPEPAGGGFGLGIFEEEAAKKEARRREPAPRPEPAPEPRREPAPKPEPAPEPEPEGGGFGAGLV